MKNNFVENILNIVVGYNFRNYFFSEKLQNMNERNLKRISLNLLYIKWMIFYLKFIIL